VGRRDDEAGGLEAHTEVLVPHWARRGDAAIVTPQPRRCT
jgi:hypothetical protein